MPKKKPLSSTKDMSVMISGRTDSVDPAAIPWRIRQAMWVLYELLVAAPMVEPRRRTQQPSITGRRPKAMERGKIKKQPEDASVPVSRNGPPEQRTQGHDHARVSSEVDYLLGCLALRSVQLYEDSKNWSKSSNKDK